MRREADPLAFYRHRNAKLRECMKWLGFAEMYIHAGNRAGKTTWGAAIAVSLLRRMRVLDGETLPEMPEQVTGLLIVPSYKQAAGSSLPLILQLIGTWPHEIKKNGSSIERILVKQRGNRSHDSATWSVLWVYPIDGTRPEGINADFVWADEPPTMSAWEAATFRKKAGGGVLIRFITATPLNRHPIDGIPGWDDLQKRFPASCLWAPNEQRRVRIQTAMADNAALTASDIEELERTARGSLLEAARLRGEHIDATNLCPFPMEVLANWRSMARPPDAVHDFTAEPESPMSPAITATFEQWTEVDENDVALLVYDPALGIDDERHDPDCIHVWSMRRRALIGRVNARLGEYAGAMAVAQAADAYEGLHPARIVVLRTGGYGLRAISILRKMRNERRPDKGIRRWQILSDDREAMKNGASDQLGVTETHQSRQKAVTALQQALVTGDAVIPSEAVVECLARCVIDQKGKIVAGPGSHDEDLICAGIALSMIQTRGDRLPTTHPSQQPTSVQTFKDSVNKTFGREVFKARRPFGHMDNDVGHWG